MRIVSVFLVLLVAACSWQPSVPQFNQPNDQTISTAHALFERYAEVQQQALALQQWPQLSAESLQQQLGEYQHLQQQLEALLSQELNADTFVSREVLLQQLQVDIAMAQNPEFSLFAAQGNGWPIRAINILLFETDITNLSDAQHYLQRLQSLPNLIAQWQEWVVQASEHNALPAPLLMQAFEQRLRQAVSEEVLWEDFQQKLGNLPLYSNSQRLLENKARRFINQVHSSLTVAANKLASLPQQQGNVLASLQGQRYYHDLLTAYTSGRLGAIQLQQLGLREVERLNQEIAQHLTAFPNQQAPASVPFQLADISASGRHAASQFAAVPQTPLALVQWPQTKAGQPLPHYVAASESSGRPGIFYMNEKAAVTAARYADYLNAPYVHIQWALAQENTQLPDFRRRVALANFNQGWALFSQSLATSNAQQQLGALLNELAAASRLVVDTSLYGKGWSIDEALDYLAHNTPFSAAQQQRLLQDCLAMPAYHSAATLQLQQWRAFKTAHPGELYSDLLSQGALPASTLELWYLAWRKK